MRDLQKILMEKLLTGKTYIRNFYEYNYILRNEMKIIFLHFDRNGNPVFKCSVSNEFKAENFIYKFWSPSNMFIRFESDIEVNEGLSPTLFPIIFIHHFDNFYYNYYTNIEDIFNEMKYFINMKTKYFYFIVGCGLSNDLIFYISKFLP